MRYVVMLVSILLVGSTGYAEEAAPESGTKTLSGMSVLGNNEAPKALVIVPWKSSQIGDGIGVVESLSNRPMPVDRDVFGRELDYYYIRSGDTLPDDLAGQSLDVGVR